MGRFLRSFASIGTFSFLLLTLVSSRSRKAKLYLNTLLYILGMGVCSSIGVTYGLISCLWPGKRFNTNYVVARSFYYLIRSIIGISMTIEGEKNLRRRPAIIVGNHQSVLDILYLGRMFPPRSIIMAKKELRFAPLLGQFMMLSGSAFIDRKNRSSALQTMNSIGQHMRKNNLMMFMFPEGTRSHFAKPDLLPFKKGAFHLAVQTQLPIIPVVCENYHSIYDSKTRFEPGHIRLAVLPPVETTGMKEQDVDDLTQKVYNMMKEQLVAFANDRESPAIAAPEVQKPRL